MIVCVLCVLSLVQTSQMDRPAGRRAVLSSKTGVQYSPRALSTRSRVILSGLFLNLVLVIVVVSYLGRNTDAELLVREDSSSDSDV